MQLKSQILSALATASADLIAAMRDGRWEGRLSSSALSTATAISGMALFIQHQPAGGQPQTILQSQIQRGIDWLVQQANPDGGFGDTDKSRSNIATTMLVIAALGLAGVADRHAELLVRANGYVDSQGSVEGIRRRYGRDKTFAAPILANAALAGLVPWSEVASLPFEAAWLPQSWYRLAKLPVVSYAIPALVAIGQVKFRFDPPRNPLVRAIRHAAFVPATRVLSQIQPASGGYLEAIPLTSFVVMSLAASGRADAEVTSRGIDFLCKTQRADGSWPIDTNLATWTTTLATLAIANSARHAIIAPEIDLDWILACQNRERHPYTGAAPGGWGWSDLSGAVPDADDTPAALLALKAIETTWRKRGAAEAIEQQVRLGIRWLLDLQNRDGGWPTFCRGWGNLPFDRSGSDLTAHALRALQAWRSFDDSRIERAMTRGLAYLEKHQRSDGSWLPLWFGNQDRPDDENPVYGTAKVVCAYRDLGLLNTTAAHRGGTWLLNNQNGDGGWGGGDSVRWPLAELGSSTVEETALATEALADFADRENFALAFERGANWLAKAVGEGFHKVPSPIGFYFAKLWYYEDLYPLIFSVSALSRAADRWSSARSATASSSF